MAKNKYYVVWKGLNPGVYDNWAACKMQVEGQDGAKYKSFETREEASEAFGDFGGLDAWAGGAALALGREAPMTLGRLQEGAEAAQDPIPQPMGNSGTTDEVALMREEIRRMVLEELRSALRQ